MRDHADEKRYQLRIELNDIRPKIWREVIVPESVSLVWLHEIIQEAMGWMDCHLHQFEHKRKRYAQPDEDEWEKSIDEGTVALNQLLKKVGDQLTYTYDFGDDWQHRVQLKKILPPDSKKIVHLLAAEGACPPEDCGGPYTYMELLGLRKARAQGKDLSREEREHLDWFDLVSDDDEFIAEDIEEVNETFQQMLDHALSEGGMGTDGATVYGGVFKPHELDDEDDEEFDGFINAMGADRSGQMALGGLDEESAGLEAPDFPEPYEDLSEPDAELFKDALTEANRLRALEPWKQLFDSDLFGIEDPETGEIALVSILGANKEVFSLHVHRPPQGFAFWKEALVDSDDLGPDFVLNKCSIIEVEFRNKADMEQPDLLLYETLGFDTPSRGRKKWALFRNYQPRRMPWFPDAQKLPLLIRGMRLTGRYLEQMAVSAEPESFLLGSDAGSGLPGRLKVFQLQSGGDEERPESWELNEVAIDWQSCGKEAAPFQPSEFEVQQLANLPRTEGHWELGAIVFPNPVMTEAGPVLPLLALAADTLHAEPPAPYLSSDPDDSPTRALWDCLKERALGLGSLPAELHVATDSAEATLESLEEVAGIRVVRKEQLNFLGALFQSMSMLSPEEM